MCSHCVRLQHGGRLAECIISSLVTVIHVSVVCSCCVRLQHGGRLAEWKGPGTKWAILASTAFVEVTGRRNFGKVMYALGWDSSSVILKVFDGDNPGEFI